MEFALLLPILIMLLFGIISGGLLWNQQLTVTQAVREGARYGATVPIDNATKWEDDVATRVEEASGFAIDPSRPGHLIEVDEPDDEGRIRVYAQRPGTLDVIFWARHLSISAQAVARHEDVES